MQTKGVRGQKMPRNANVICERPLTCFFSFQKAKIFIHFTGFSIWDLGCRSSHHASVVRGIPEGTLGVQRSEKIKELKFAVKIANISND